MAKSNQIKAKGNGVLPNLQNKLARATLASMLNATDESGYSLIDRANAKLKELYRTGNYRYSTMFMNKYRVLLADPNIGTKYGYFRKSITGENSSLFALQKRVELMQEFVDNKFLDPQHIQARLTVDSRRFGLSEEQYKFMMDFFHQENIEVFKDYDSDSMISSVSMFIQDSKFTNRNKNKLQGLHDKLEQIYNKKSAYDKDFKSMYDTAEDYFVDTITSADPTEIDKLINKFNRTGEV